jgi:hypothetical protein
MPRVNPAAPGHGLPGAPFCSPDPPRHVQQGGSATATALRRAATCAGLLVLAALAAVAMNGGSSTAPSALAVGSWSSSAMGQVRRSALPFAPLLHCDKKLVWFREESSCPSAHPDLHLQSKSGNSAVHQEGRAPTPRLMFSVPWRDGDSFQCDNFPRGSCAPAGRSWERHCQAGAECRRGCQRCSGETPD